MYISIWRKLVLQYPMKRGKWLEKIRRRMAFEGVWKVLQLGRVDRWHRLVLTSTKAKTTTNSRSLALGRTSTAPTMPNKVRNHFHSRVLMKFKLYVLLYYQVSITPCKSILTGKTTTNSRSLALGRTSTAPTMPNKVRNHFYSWVLMNLHFIIFFAHMYPISRWLSYPSNYHLSRQ